MQLLYSWIRFVQYLLERMHWDITFRFLLSSQFSELGVATRLSQTTFPECDKEAIRGAPVYDRI